jgi:acyl-CoA synthetase
MQAPTDVAQAYVANGWWSTRPLGDLVRQRAQESPDAAAYLGTESLSWGQYDAAADRVAGQLAALGPARGARVAVFLPDGPALHMVYLACERAGLVVVGIPERAGDRELAHLVARTAASLLVCPETARERTAAQIAEAVRRGGAQLDRHVVVGADWTVTAYDAAGEAVATDASATVAVEGRGLRADELWLLNSTSGTTGLPKCVRQTQNRWLYLLSLARDAARLDGDDVLMSLVPGPFGFGLWTAHFAPAVLGVPCVLQPRFDAGAALRAAAEHSVTVLACVTTQFQLMLRSPALADVDLTALRVLYTGGEAVPPESAREWERRTGSTVLQFYGSNEIGPFSCTRLDDPEPLRLTTVGRLAAGLDYRIYDEAGEDVTSGGGPGQPGGRGPGGYGGGYWDDPAADAELFTDDGYLLMPDVVTVDADGYVRIAGRKSDIIIRGGKNISAASVEADVGRHPAIELVAALPVPDPVFGERVCAVVVLRDGASLELPELVAFLAEQGVSKECFPEYLAVVDELPQSMGGKVAKRELRQRLPELLGLC